MAEFEIVETCNKCGGQRSGAPEAAICAHVFEKKVILTGSEPYWSGWQYGNALDELFPGQDCADFGQAVGNDSGPINPGNSVVGLVMTQEGCNDGPNWIWRVTMQDGSVWECTGWCDYTGWDCRSGTSWEKVGDLIHPLEPTPYASGGGGFCPSSNYFNEMYAEPEETVPHHDHSMEIEVMRANERMGAALSHLYSLYPQAKRQVEEFLSDYPFTF